MNIDADYRVKTPDNVTKCYLSNQALAKILSDNSIPKDAFEIIDIGVFEVKKQFTNITVTNRAAVFIVFDVNDIVERV